MLLKAHERQLERQQLRYEPAASSIYGATPYFQDNSFLIIGERLNASGSKKVRELLNEEDWDGLIAVARGQVKENAHVLDVNVDYVGRDGEKDMHELVTRVVTNVNLPLMLDSTEWQKMEAGLKVAGGKCILNSTNYEDGDERFFKVLELASGQDTTSSKYQAKHLSFQVCVCMHACRRACVHSHARVCVLK